MIGISLSGYELRSVSVKTDRIVKAVLCRPKDWDDAGEWWDVLVESESSRIHDVKDAIRILEESGVDCSKAKKYGSLLDGVPAWDGGVR